MKNAIVASWVLLMVSSIVRAALPGEDLLHTCQSTWSTKADWEARAASLRKQILGPLAPWPPQTSLNPVWRTKIIHDGYTVQPVAIESMPGFYCMVDLYEPAQMTGRRPAIIRAHGHGSSGRYGTQEQCAAMARMGAVVLSISMVGYNDCQQYCQEHTSAHPPGPAVFSLQLLNLIRCVDFVAALPEVDANNINITGESGGGTQTFMLAAVDSRIKIAIPVVMVSATHTGCLCEKGPAGLVPSITNHAEIAALHAPLPQLVISDGKDWTKYVPQVELPYLQKVYSTMDAADQVENVHLADEGHDYGPSKRNAAYAFFIKHGVLAGTPDETIARDSDEALSVFNDKNPLPAAAMKTPAEIEKALAHLFDAATPAPAKK